MTETAPAPSADIAEDSASRQAILRAIAGITYGSVEVTIHDGRIVQIECREKIRLGEAQQRNSVRQFR
ncbi:MAG TPA: YezD family protein [Burkholderiales bacterium]|jgi:hypothetical protein|nr:YezD family protein [Burkholderiales bacterium]